MISFKELSHKLLATKWRWVVFGLAAAPTIHFYYVREMIAALMIFSVLFAAIFVVIVVLFLLDRASERIVVWCEAGASHVARWIADGIEGIIARPAWAHAVPPRFRKEQLKESKKI